MIPNLPPFPELVTRREGWSAAIGVTLATVACIATGFLIAMVT